MIRVCLISLLVLLLCLEHFAGGARGAEEAIRTPSDQMKDAVDKLNKSPATIGKSLQGLTDAAKAKLKQTFGSGAKTDTKAEPVDLNVPKKTPETPASSRALKEGNRDPFRPITLNRRTNVRQRENLSPLERYELGQLKLVGIIWDIKAPTALVEDTSGLGYVVRVGTPIGANDGKVKMIRPDALLIEEEYIDLYGAKKKREVSMGLAVEKSE
jgi:type IV pilus assembly protein PilP